MVKEGTASLFQRREAERQRTQRRTEQIAAREREKLAEKEAAAAGVAVEEDRRDVGVQPAPGAAAAGGR